MKFSKNIKILFLATNVLCTSTYSNTVLANTPPEFKEELGISNKTIDAIKDLPDNLKHLYPEISKTEKQNIIHLDSTYNTRDLGGHQTASGKLTHYNVFLRSDDTNEMTEKDIQRLIDYGVTTVIDMRETSYKQKNPDSFSNNSTVDYHHIDVIERVSSCTNSQNFDMGNDSSIKLLEHTGEKNWQKEVFDIISESSGCVLFHCIGGKDRTGVLAMLLLGLVGVDRQEIIDNYTPSAELVRERPNIHELLNNDVTNNGWDILAKKHISPKYTIEQQIDYVINNYGTFEKYLLECGISQENLDTIKNRFV